MQEKPWIILIIACVLAGCQFNKHDFFSNHTICNPINISYQFSLNETSRRDGAHPCIILFNNEYFLFMTGAGGYFYSIDLRHWELIKTDDLPLENNAPTVVSFNNEIFFTTSYKSDTIYRTDNPKTGKWEAIYNNSSNQIIEPMLFHDNKKLYLFYGSSNVNPLYGIEIDPKTMIHIGQATPLINSSEHKNGWEVPGDQHTWITSSPWLEGIWMNKYNNKYYLQYSSPGIQFKSLNDGIYVSENPLGPFVLANHNPFAYKPEGFITGSGNGCTFQDIYGNYWFITTSVITSKHFFERRISLFPVFFDKDEIMYSYTGFGDYPMIIPNKKTSTPDELFPEWMLLSYNKKVTVSSKLRGYPARNAVNEDIRTWWSAETNNKGEYLSVDLGDLHSIYSIQLNFADHDSYIWGRNDSIYYQYLIEESRDGKKWNKLVDKSLNIEDVPHDYIQLDKKIETRHIRVTNLYCPSEKFSISGFRIFGKGHMKLPQSTNFTHSIRDPKDRRSIKLRWDEIEGATGFNIRFGTHPNKLYNNYIIYNDTEVTINCLHSEMKYYFTIDSFNEAGITKGTTIKESL